jgi:predicted dehydrogenase
MNPKTNFPSRRDFLKKAGRVAATSALAGMAIPHVHAAENNTIQLALIGSGGRGSGAVGNAFSACGGPIKLVAMADVVDERLDGSYTNLKKQFGDRIDVPEDRRFLGFDGYQKAMDCLKPGDVAILTTPAAFRWVHIGYAIKKGIHVFMEKPVTVDGPSSRKMLALGDQAAKKNLKVGVGLMCRHCNARAELLKRIKGGEIGDLLALRAYRMHGPVGVAGPVPAGTSELLYQVRRFHSFLWSGGGSFSDALIHNIDECCWIKGGWPVRAQALGGRHYRAGAVDQNFDNYSVEYTFADGTKLFLYGRFMAKCYSEFASYAHGTKGSAVISTFMHTPAKCRLYKGQNQVKSDLIWSAHQPEANPYQLEWEHLLDAIRRDKPYNEVQRGVEASLVAAMGRMAAHTGQVITHDQMLNCKHEFAPGVDQMTMDSPAPLQAGVDGKYPIPQPGILSDREF